MLLECRGLAAHIDGRVIVRDVELAVAPGTVTALIGVNGSGKSTLLRAMAGIRTPAAGNVLVDGHDLAHVSARERARRIAFVAQEEIPPDDLLVRELVALGRTPYSRPWDQGGQHERMLVERALEQVGMSSHAERSCAQLSGGERRRVMLARGLVQDTLILMLDEPTNHLDVAQQHRLLRLVREVSHAGRSVVMAIHDLAMAHLYADHVVVLQDGRVLRQGAPVDVFADPEIAAAFHIRMAIHTDPSNGSDHLVCLPLENPSPHHAGGGESPIGGTR